MVCEPIPILLPPPACYHTEIIEKSSANSARHDLGRAVTLLSISRRPPTTTTTETDRMPVHMFHNQNRKPQTPKTTHHHQNRKPTESEDQFLGDENYENDLFWASRFRRFSSPN